MTGMGISACTFYVMFAGWFGFAGAVLAARRHSDASPPRGPPLPTGP